MFITTFCIIAIINSLDLYMITCVSALINIIFNSVLTNYCSIQKQVTRNVQVICYCHYVNTKILIRVWSLILTTIALIIMSFSTLVLFIPVELSAYYFNVHIFIIIDIILIEFLLHVLCICNWLCIFSVTICSDMVLLSLLFVQIYLMHHS